MFTAELPPLSCRDVTPMSQLEDELKAGAWLALDVPPSLVIKDRVMGWRPGKPKPVWTELMGMLLEADAKVQRLIDQIYPPSST